MDGVVLSDEARAAVHGHGVEVVSREGVDGVRQLRDGVHGARGVRDLHLVQTIGVHGVYIGVHAVAHGVGDADAVAYVVGDKVGALRGAGVVGIHLAVGIEDLRLRIGVEQGEDEREDEHEGQDDDADDGQLVPEEALGYEPARREHLYAFRIVQGEGLALVVHVLLAGCLASLEGLVQAVGASFVRFCHSAQPPLNARGRAGPPRRTERQPGGWTAASGWR